MATIRSALVETAQNYIAGFNKNTPEGVIACNTSDCKQTIYPASSPPPWSNSPFTNKGYQAFVVPGFQMIRNVRITLVKGEDMIIVEVSREGVLQVKSTGEMDAGPYSDDLTIVLKMTDDGTLIKEIVESIDSATAQAMAASLAKLQGAAP